LDFGFKKMASRVAGTDSKRIGPPGFFHTEFGFL
jgi:hypothetical protein